MTATWAHSMFDSTSTAEDLLAGVNLQDRRILITGVSAGIGVETARSLAAHGAQVVGAARDRAKAEAATAGLRKDVAAPGAFELMDLNLADLNNVRSFTDRLLHAGRPFDLIIANAGVMATPSGRTVDGFETQFGTNHLGHFVLVNRLVPLMRPGSRVISVSSAGHRFADVDLADPNFEHSRYQPFIAYGRSKTANILFAVAFDQRHRQRGIRAAAVHPGAVQTELNRHLDPRNLEGMINQMNRQMEAAGSGRFQWKTIPQGAATSVWAEVVASAEDIGGQYCENCHVGKIVPNDVSISAVSEGVRAYALDPVSAEALWRRSEELVGESFEPGRVNG